MQKKFLCGGMLLLGIWSLALRSTLSAADQNPSAKDKLARIGWMQGAWTATVEGDYLDEFWSPPQDDSMIGMFRWNKKGTLWMCEMLTIVTDGDNIVLRVKHFDRALVGWEEKDKPITLPLARQTNDESVFETIDKPDAKTQSVRLTYRKTGSETMDVTLEVGGEGQHRRSEFHFARMK